MSVGMALHPSLAVMAVVSALVLAMLGALFRRPWRGVLTWFWEGALLGALLGILLRGVFSGWILDLLPG